MKTAVKSTSPTPHTQTPRFSRLDRRLAILLFALCLGIYSRTLAPGLLFGDPGEFQFAAWRFGLAHPTGYPLYLLLGGSWQHLAALFGVDPAFALNAFSALLAAAAVALFYLAVLGWLPDRAPSARIAALFAALLMGVNPTLWSQALIAEVYAFHALFVVLFLLLASRYTRSSAQPQTQSPAHASFHLLILSSLLGLSLTHHRTTLFLLPGFALWLFWQGRNRWQTGRGWAALIGGLALPQLLYLYIPLRSGAVASPWLYPKIGGETLALYTPTLQGFIDFLTGSIFAVSFLSPTQALARLPEAANLWLVHFTWPGLVLALLGLGVLIRQRRWSLLLLTLPAALLLQIFNLFYGIGDIYVFYIPLYLFAALWAGWGVAWLMGMADRRRQATSDGPDTQHTIRNAQLALWFLLLLTLPISLFITHLPAMDQSGNRAARRMWNTILAGDPPGNAILVSNDRNEIVPLYYLQAVEGKAPGLTGLFPLLTPEARFADVGAVTETALAAGDRPVFLIKEMAGLEAKFDLAPAAPPLIRVVGGVSAAEITRRLDLTYGPLTLLGYDVGQRGESLSLSLFWRVNESLVERYTSSVQLFAAGGQWLAQDDRPPGGDYYPTSLWKVGEVVRDTHLFPLGSGEAAGKMQVLFYARRPETGNDTEAELIHLAPVLEIGLP
ncbi:MAG: DUF2723 domain-containing protein [Caldilineaceae bacterium]|nr:DUF2723 domain-containing protein [Caldilineaceae bacterium]